MEIRPARLEEIEEIMKIYDKAKAFMMESGNPGQWVNGYPQRELIERDIRRGDSFVCCEDGRIHGVFSFIIGEDPTYAVIEDGQWLSEEPYGTVHRIAGDGEISGMMDKVFPFCLQRIACLRGDTHADNKKMQHLFLKNGFKRCGIIYTENGSPRIAYQLPAKD
jgi:hypothetical protein